MGLLASVARLQTIALPQGLPGPLRRVRRRQRLARSQSRWRRGLLGLSDRGVSPNLNKKTDRTGVFPLAPPALVASAVSTPVSCARTAPCQRRDRNSRASCAARRNAAGRDGQADGNREPRPERLAQRRVARLVRSGLAAPPDLHIVSGDAWTAAHERLALVRAKYLTGAACASGSPHHGELKDLLAWRHSA